MNIRNTTLKFYNTSEKRFYEVVKVEYSTTGFINKIISRRYHSTKKDDGYTERVFENKEGDLIASTTMYDKEIQELFDGDMVKCLFLDSQPRFIFYDNGWRVFGCTTEEFQMNLDMIEKIGNRWDDSKEYENYKKKFNIN